MKVNLKLLEDGVILNNYNDILVLKKGIIRMSGYTDNFTISKNVDKDIYKTFENFLESLVGRYYLILSEYEKGKIPKDFITLDSGETIIKINSDLNGGYITFRYTKDNIKLAIKGNSENEFDMAYSLMNYPNFYNEFKNLIYNLEVLTGLPVSKKEIPDYLYKINTGFNLEKENDNLYLQNDGKVMEISKNATNDVIFKTFRDTNSIDVGNSTFNYRELEVYRILENYMKHVVGRKILRKDENLTRDFVDVNNGVIILHGLLGNIVALEYARSRIKINIIKNEIKKDIMAESLLREFYPDYGKEDYIEVWISLTDPELKGYTKYLKDLYNDLDNKASNRRTGQVLTRAR